jgi:organic radical activating enzyme
MNLYPIEVISTLKSEILEIRWMPHNVCNFKCRYCFPGSFEGYDKPPQDLDLVIKNITHLMNWYKENLNKTKFHFKILGGEPTLFKGLETVIKELKNNFDVYTTIISNGSRTLRWWQENGHLFDNAVLSYHAPQADLDHHIAVADTLYALGKKVTVLSLMDPTIWDKCVADIEYMKKHGKHKWFIQAKELVDYGQPDPITYTPEQKKYLNNEHKQYPSVFWFLKNIQLIFDGSIRLYESKTRLNDGSTIGATAQTYINKDWNNFKGWSCNIGLDVLFISSNGDVTGSCGQRIYNLNYSHNILKQDFVDTFDPEPIPTICGLDKCTCQPETHISKFDLGTKNVSKTSTAVPITFYGITKQG